MILKEARKIGLPIIGLINSHCTVEIDYPIFAQDQTLQSIHFFCHFLATLIAKETIFFQHKRYTLQKIQSKAKTSSEINLKECTSEQKESISQQTKKHILQKGKIFQQLKEP